MFGKMMNRYYYGKSGKGDFQKEDLPQNRWQLFWETLRVRFSSLVRLNLMYAVVWLPTIIVIARAIFMLYSGLAGLADMQAQVDAGTMAADVLATNTSLFGEAVRAIVMQTLLLLVPCLAITGPCTAGVCYVTRNWARDEHAFIWSDFRDALKENWKPALATSTITAFMPLILYVCTMFYGDMAKSSMLYVVPQVLSVSIVLVWLCALMYIYPQMVTYRLNYRGLIKNSLFLTIARLPMTLGLKLLSLLPALICAAVSLLTPYMQYAVMLLGLYYIVLGFSLSRFVAASYTNGVFDRYINNRIEGAEVNRGLYVEEDEEDGEAQADSSPSANEEAAPKA
ncbi:MAG: YesL family protein [Clostridia bacterium]